MSGKLRQTPDSGMCLYDYCPNMHPPNFGGRGSLCRLLGWWRPHRGPQEPVCGLSGGHDGVATATYSRSRLYTCGSGLVYTVVGNRAMIGGEHCEDCRPKYPGFFCQGNGKTYTVVLRVLLSANVAPATWCALSIRRTPCGSGDSVYRTYAPTCIVHASTARPLAPRCTGPRKTNRRKINHL